MRPGGRIFAAEFANQVESVTGYRLDSDTWSFERWQIVPGTLLVNRQRQTIRFSVTALGTDPPEPFQVVLREAPYGWVLKADCMEEPSVEYAVRVFESQGAVLFVFSGKVNQVYILIETLG